jgi:hypothetical protein
VLETPERIALYPRVDDVVKASQARSNKAMKINVDNAFIVFDASKQKGKYELTKG